MAQNNKDIKKAVNELFDDYEKSLTKAAKYAFDEAVKDIYVKANTCLDEYYESYIPTSYERTDNLWRCIASYGYIKRNKNYIHVQAGVDYDASVLENTYYGSKKHSPTDSEWVISNYLRGVHPYTDGTRNKSETIPADYYFELIDEVSPEQKMQTFLEQYIEESFYMNVLFGLAKQVF